MFTKVWGPKDKVTKPATKQVWFYDMEDDGYTLDDKRSKKEGFGDLQDIVTQFHSRGEVNEWDRTQRFFAVPRKEIEDESYDLSFSRYKEDVFEEIEYDAPSVIVGRLLEAEVGVVDEKVLKKVEGGIVKELLELRGMIE